MIGKRLPTCSNQKSRAGNEQVAKTLMFRPHVQLLALNVCPRLWLAANYAAFTYVVCGQCQCQCQQQRRQRLRQRIGNGTYVWAKSAVCLVAVAAAAANFVLCIKCI